MFKPLLSSMIIISSLLATGCSTLFESDSAQEQSSPLSHTVSSCHAIYDAGSSGTRLYLYQQKDEQWLSHEGPKVSALADPIRDIRGKSWADAGAVTDEVVQALRDIRSNGPLTEKGEPEWQGFDWQTECQLHSVRVLATAGMRIAEQENRQRSAQLWQMLKGKLEREVSSGVRVDARTLTGYEEGLYAWLALRDKNPDSGYGIAEMGGASSQITFPCPECDDRNNAVRKVLVKGQLTKIYSYSFLGLGQDEAPKTLAFPESCAYGIGEGQPDWKPMQCADKIPLTQGDEGLKDPYNYAGGVKGTVNNPPIAKGEQKHWFLTGAFSYMKTRDIKDCCESKGACYNPQTSCFTSVYRPKYLETLTIPIRSAQADVSWTLGANVCATTECLSQARAPICRWSKEGCL